MHEASLVTCWWLNERHGLIRNLNIFFRKWTEFLIKWSEWFGSFENFKLKSKNFKVLAFELKNLNEQCSSVGIFSEVYWRSFRKRECTVFTVSQKRSEVSHLKFGPLKVLSFQWLSQSSPVRSPFLQIIQWRINALHSLGLQIVKQNALWTENSKHDQIRLRWEVQES